MIPLLILAASLPEGECLQRISSHQLIEDYKSALFEAKQGVQNNPSSRLLREEEIIAYFKSGQEKEGFKAWEKFSQDFQNPYQSDRLLEEMAWGVIFSGSCSSSPMTRGIAMLAAHFSQTARGVKLLVANLHDSNALIRAMALKLSSGMRDQKLKEVVFEQFQKETVWSVKLEAIQAVGVMKIKEAEAPLKELVASSIHTKEERGAALTALAHLMDQPDEKDCRELLLSNRVGLRLLGCELIARHELVKAIPLLFPLLKDNQGEVRFAAAQTLGILRAQEAMLGLQGLLDDPIPDVALAAAWALTVLNSSVGESCFFHYLSDQEEEVRCFAAGCLAATGERGISLMQRVFQVTQDPLVKLNVGLGLIGQRIEVKKAASSLAHVLIHDKEPLMWLEKGIFRAVAPSTVRYREDVPQYPEMVNQETRLALIQILTFIHDIRAKEAMRQFLERRIVSLTAPAMALILTEGDEEALSVVRPLEEDSDLKVRSQAILILALWGREEKTLRQLEALYQEAPRALKEHILEALGQIGDKSSLPFLVAKLREPNQHLRMIAAAAVIQCINH